MGAERLQVLLRWLATDLGELPGQCPSNAAIAQRVGLSAYNQATCLLTRAEAAGLITFISPRKHAQRIIRVLPAGLDLVRPRAARAPVQPMPFEAWLSDAQPGDRYTYFVGHLAEMRGVLPHRRTTEIRLALAQAASADKAAEAGLVLRTTQRQPDGQCAYLAIRRRLAA